MKSNVFIFFIFLFLLVGCKSSLINYALEKKGLYDENISIQSYKYENKEIVFLPMQHIGREEYYTNVKNKIDSLKSENYIFFYEKIINNTADTLDLYKFRKIIHFAVPQNGYINLLDSLYKSGLDFKYKLVNQPNIESFGLSNSNSYNIDLSIKEIVNNVERTKNIVLESCDIMNSYRQTYKCKNKFLSEEEWRRYIITDRDKNLFDEVKNSNFQKIAIIYGKAHLTEFENLISK